MNPESQLLIGISKNVIQLTTSTPAMASRRGVPGRPVS
jgi:hypothetical protein